MISLQYIFTHLLRRINVHFLLFNAIILPFTQVEWSPWNAWSLCYEQNGISAQTRTRAWLGDPGKNPGNDMQAKACLPAETKAPGTHADFPQAPPPQLPPPPSPPQPVYLIAQAEWSQWTEWSECQSLPDGTSPPFRSRWRICDRRRCDAAHSANIGGTSAKVECQPCHGQPMEQQNCPIPAPTENHQHEQQQPGGGGTHAPQCQWSEWSNWSSCSTSCGTGIRIRMRVCPCGKCPDGPSQEEENCYNLLPCGGGHSAPPPPPPPPPPIPWAQEWAIGWPNMTMGGGMGGFNPCNYCPPMYALPCYTCLNMQAQQQHFGKK